MCWWGKLLDCFCIPALWSTCKMLRKKILGADLCFWCDRGHSSCWNFTFVCWLVHKEQKCKHWILFETWFGPHLPSKTERVILISNCKFLAYIMKTFSVMMFSPMKVCSFCRLWSSLGSSFLIYLMYVWWCNLHLCSSKKMIWQQWNVLSMQVSFLYVHSCLHLYLAFRGVWVRITSLLI